MENQDNQIIEDEQETDQLTNNNETTNPVGRIKKIQKILLIIFGIIFFVGVGFTSHYFYKIKKNNNLTNHATKSQSIKNINKQDFQTKNEKVLENKKATFKTYQNKLWGIEFKYPDDREISIRDLEGQIDISVYANKKLNHKNNLYFNPATIDSMNIVDFESLKNYLNSNKTNGESVIFKNNNGIYFYKIIMQMDYSHYAYYYAFYEGKKPFNIIKLKHRLDDHMKPENKELFENIINNFNYIEIDDELAESFFRKKQINPECAGWYASNKYRGKNHLKNLSEIKNIVSWK